MGWYECKKGVVCKIYEEEAEAAYECKGKEVSRES